MRKTTAGLLTGVFATLILAGVTDRPAAAATQATGTITGLAGKCVDVAAANTANGTAVDLYDCNGSGAQRPPGRARIIVRGARGVGSRRERLRRRCAV